MLITAEFSWHLSQRKCRMEAGIIPAPYNHDIPPFLVDYPEGRVVPHSLLQLKQWLNTFLQSKEILAEFEGNYHFQKRAEASLLGCKSVYISLLRSFLVLAEAIPSIWTQLATINRECWFLVLARLLHAWASCYVSEKVQTQVSKAVLMALLSS